MTSKDFFLALDALEREKGISREKVIESLETALAIACKKHFGEASNVIVKTNPEKFTIRAYISKTIVEVVEVPEKEISLEEAQELMKLCEPGMIDKTRYLVQSGKHVFEVDEFYGENEGLTIAEVELSAKDESYEKPDFIGDEVTGDVRYYNSFLMKNPFSQW